MNYAQLTALICSIMFLAVTIFVTATHAIS